MVLHQCKRSVVDQKSALRPRSFKGTPPAPEFSARYSPTPALVAQGIEHRPPEPCAQVRILPRALPKLLVSAPFPTGRAALSLVFVNRLTAISRIPGERADKKASSEDCKEQRHTETTIRHGFRSRVRRFECLGTLRKVGLRLSY